MTRSVGTVVAPVTAFVACCRAAGLPHCSDTTNHKHVKYLT